MADEKTETTVENETGLVAKEPEMLVHVDDLFEGGSGLDLIDGGRPSIIKLDHKSGRYFFNDDPDKRFESFLMTIVVFRAFFRKFGDHGIACYSDDGVTGRFVELEKNQPCTDCEYYYGLKNFQGDGQCSLGLTLQGIANIEDISTPVQLNLSQSSAKSFKAYAEKLRRSGKQFREVTTQLGSRYIVGKFKYYAAEFSTAEETPVVDAETLEETNFDPIA